jgi:hypothetical protein
MSTLIADYEAPRTGFEALLGEDCARRILLFHGKETGTGKTTLLTFCRQRIRNTIPHAEIQLRGKIVGLAEIFYRMSSIIKWEKMPNFTQRLAEIEGTPKVQIDRNWLTGINNKISVALRVEKQDDREQRQAALTDAWFQDAATLGRIIVLFDTYEQAPTEVQDWISGPFLARVALTSSIRVVIAGQQVPDRKNIEWGECCDYHGLYGVKEAKHWMPVLAEMKRRVPIKDPESWLAGVCYALNGNPDLIMKAIEGLPGD